MKQTIAAIALFGVALVLCGVILVLVGSTTAQRREHGSRAAEPMIRRIYDGADKITDACGRARITTGDCNYLRHYALSFAQRIRELAADGNEKQLAVAAYVMQNFEANTEATLKMIAERR